MAYISSLFVSVGFHCQNAVHNFVVVQVSYCVRGRVGVVIFNDGGGQAPSEIVLLDQAFFKSALSREKFLSKSMLTYKSSFVKSGCRPITLRVFPFY